MPLTTTCPKCGRRLRMKETLAGKTGRCPACHEPFPVTAVGIHGDETVQASQEVHETRAAGATTLAPSAEDLPLKSLGRFQLRAVLGSGTFGTVYRAYDSVLERDIALKVPNSATLEPRFLDEAKAAANLRHPHIVAVYDAGRVDSCWYIASEYVEGAPLSSLIDPDEPANTREDCCRAAQWVRSVAQALAYAHQEGVIHRDVKPHNIMVDRQGRPKLTDFGLAKRVAVGATPTTEGSVVGTPAYMAPEQARGEISAVGPCSDQYSVGVVLYQLLAGRLPFEGPQHKVLYDAIHTPPPPLRQMCPHVPRDMETICLKAMSKEVGDRYADCDALAEDLRRWLDDEPIRARRLSLLEQTVRLARKNPTITVLLGVILLLGTVSLIVGMSLWKEANRQRLEAKRLGEDVGQLKEEVKELIKTKETVEAAADAARAKLAAVEKAVPEAEQKLQGLEAEKKALEANIARITGTNNELLTHTASLNEQLEKKEKELVKFDADAKEKIARITEETRKLEAEAREKTYRDSIELAHNAILAKDALLAEEFLDRCPPEWRGWEWRYLKRLCFSPLPALVYRQEKETVNAVVYADNDRYLMSGSSEGVLREWMADSPVSPSAWKHRQEVGAIASAHARPWIASASADGKICIWDLSTDHDKALRRQIEVGSEVSDLEFSLDDRYLVAAGPLRKVTIWQVDAPDQPPASFHTPQGTANCVAFSPHGRLLAGTVGGAAGSEPVIYAWDFPSGTNLREWKGHTRTVNALAVSRDGRWIASGSADQSVRIWDTTGTQEPRVLTAHTDSVTAVGFIPDSTRLFSAGKDEKLIVWDTANWRPFLTLPGKGQDTTPGTRKEFTSMTITRDGSRIATGSTDRMIKVWNAEYEPELQRIPAHKSAIKRVAFSSDGTRFATACEDGTVQIWQLTPRQIIREWSKGHRSAAECCAFSPDGSLLASVARDGSLHLWKADAAEPVKKLLGEKGVLWAVAFYPQPARAWLAVAGPGRTLRILDVANGRVVHSLNGHEDDVYTVAFSPDGKLLASAGKDKTVLLWDVDAGTRVAVFPGHPGVIRSVAFGPDSAWIASAGDDKRVLMHDVRSGRVLANWDSDSPIRSLAVSPRQGWLACGCENHIVHFWDRRSTFTGSSSRGHARAVNSVAFSPDETQLISGDDCGVVKIWRVEQPSVPTEQTARTPSGAG